jgi:SAM-dependent methyltransferase
MDLVSDALRFSADSGHDSLIQASATHLPFSDSTFDLVTSFDVLVQLPGSDADEHAISEMFRVLRPGGIAFVRVAAYRWMLSDHDRDLGTQTRYTLDEIAEKLAGAGFAIVRRTYANSLLFPVAAVRRLLLKRIGLAGKGSDVKPLPLVLSWLNSPMTNALRTEASFLQALKRQLPFGLSAICIAKKAEH